VVVDTGSPGGAPAADATYPSGARITVAGRTVLVLRAERD
jgi:hypothetical protein